MFRTKVVIKVKCGDLFKVREVFTNYEEYTKEAGRFILSLVTNDDDYFTLKCKRFKMKVTHSDIMEVMINRHFTITKLQALDVFLQNPDLLFYMRCMKGMK